MKSVSIAALYGVVAVLMFNVLSLLAWHVFPYPTGSTQPMRTRIWMTHLLAEKTANILICGIVALLAARAYRPSWKSGMLTGVLAAVAFQMLAIILYLIRFGFARYVTYHSFMRTTFETIIFGGLFSFLAVWPQYRRDVHKV